MGSWEGTLTLEDSGSCFWIWREPEGLAALSSESVTPLQMATCWQGDLGLLSSLGVCWPVDCFAISR